MGKINSLMELNESIRLLELKQAEDANLLREQFMETYENLKPVNLIKNSVKDFVSSPDFKENILKTTLGLAAGYLSKKAIVGSTHNPLKQLLGTFLQMGVANLVSKNSDGIKSLGLSLFKNFIKQKSTVD